MYVLQQRFHHVTHLDEERANLLVVVATLHVQLHYDAEGADGDCNPDGNQNPSIRDASYE